MIEATRRMSQMTQVTFALLVPVGAGLFGLGTFAGYLMASLRHVTHRQPRWSEQRAFATGIAQRQKAPRALRSAPTPRVRRRDKTARLESAEHFHTVTEGLPIPVLLTCTTSGQILYANAMCHLSFGLPPAALIGRSIVDFYDDPTQRQTMLKALRRKGTLYDYALHFRRVDGTSFRGLTSLHTFTFNGESAIIEWIHA
jgi:PAS domain-containing protein